MECVGIYNKRGCPGVKHSERTAFLLCVENSAVYRVCESASEIVNALSPNFSR